MKVSVITTAYKHEKTLQRAIDSVRDQSGVEFEHIIIDDTKRNFGMMLTFLEAFGKVKGEYIAFCDGDDRWIYYHKLFDQINYMDSHPECGLCLHKVYTVSGDGIFKVPDIDINKVLTFDHILRGSAYIFAQSYLLRRSDFEKYIDFEGYIKNGFKLWDLPLVLDLIQHTKFHCLDFSGAVYTKNSESVTNTRNRAKRLRYILAQYQIKLYFIRKYGCRFDTKIYLTYRFVRHLISIIFKRWK